MRSTRTLALAAVGTGVLLLAACGDHDEPADSASSGSTRTVEIEMVDIAFEPDTVEVDAGETIRFVFTNTGEVAHDAFVGDRAAQMDHEAEMRGDVMDMDHGGRGSDDGDGVTVEPGEHAELNHTFDDPGSLEIGCHQEGHYAAGMKVSVEVD